MYSSTYIIKRDIIDVIISIILFYLIVVWIWNFRFFFLLFLEMMTMLVVGDQFRSIQCMQFITKAIITKPFSFVKNFHLYHFKTTLLALFLLINTIILFSTICIPLLIKHFNFTNLIRIWFLCILMHNGC